METSSTSAFFFALRRISIFPPKCSLPLLLVCLGGFAPAGSSAAAELAAPPRERLDRANLLEFRNANGVVLPVRSVAEWRERRAEILAGAQAVMGRLPGPEKRIPLDVLIEEEKDFGDYVRRRITYASEPGSRTPAHLFLPKSLLEDDAGDPSPGVLCLMGTGGHKLEDVPPGPDIGGNLQDGEALARRGLVAIAPAYPSLGFGSRSGLSVDYDPDLRQLGYESGTMKAIWDNLRALDLLAELPGVKKSGFGAIGHSLGGHNSIYTAAFDDRIRVVVSSCGFDSFLDYRPTAWQPGKGWAQDRYMPKILDYAREDIPFDFHELVGALAPRPLFVNAPVGDSNFHWQSVDRVVAAGVQIYRLYNVPDLLRVFHPDAGHDFPGEIREASYDWMEQFLR